MGGVILLLGVEYRLDENTLDLKGENDWGYFTSKPRFLISTQA